MFVFVLGCWFVGPVCGLLAMLGALIALRRENVRGRAEAALAFVVGFMGLAFSVAWVVLLRRATR
ncbi:MAG: hypothetical protein QGI33_06370 [Candidatus Brocadiia bacterium]|nr:hypothetical protein [Candidatus Brocadiia bacterium]